MPPRTKFLPAPTLSARVCIRITPMAGFEAIVRFFCRASYFISLLGLKIPLGLLARASHARYVLGFIVSVVVPFHISCHLALLPAVREAAHGVAIWHTLTAMWVTLPLLVVGLVIVSHVRALGPLMCLVGGSLGMACFHWYCIPALQPTLVGTILLQLLFAFFEDGSIAGWIWCLYHVVDLQNHVQKHPKLAECPIEGSSGKESESAALVVGNAPSVTMGRPLGLEIDGFQDVARFNAFNTNLTEHTGSKVTYHFCNGRKLPTTKTLRVVLPLFNASLTHAVYLIMPLMEDARETCENLKSGKADVWFVDEERILALRRKIGVNFWQIPSSGMVAIDAFLSKHEQISLHGFNFFQGKKIHYFEESAVQLITSWLERFVTHNPPQEKLWVESLMKDGKAMFLHDRVRGKMDEDAREAEALAEALDASSPTVSECKKKAVEDGEARRRPPGLLRTILKDGIPSQFSI